MLEKWISPRQVSGCFPDVESASMLGSWSMTSHMNCAAEAARVICTICGAIWVIDVAARITAKMTLSRQNEVSKIQIPYPVERASEKEGEINGKLT
jgi:hypothetical protein